MALWRSIFLTSTKYTSLNLSETVMSYLVRNISSVEVTKNLTLYSNDDIVKKNMNRNKPLVIMMCWLMAKPKHILKYADLYVNNGFDVISVRITPWQLLWPAKGTQVVASDIVNFLNTNNLYQPLVIHGFSVGGYVWAEALVQLAANRNSYQPILNKFVAQVWDSLADITEIIEGFPSAVFPRNQLLQSAFRAYIAFHLKLFNKHATSHYLLAREHFHNNVIKCPALLFISKSDPVGSEKSNLQLKKNWENIGISVHWKCWDSSPHVSHFYHHPEEYRAILAKFFADVGIAWKQNENSQIVAKNIKAKL